MAIHTYHPDSLLIDKVGPKTVASTFGLSSQTLHMWRRRGIPVLKRHAFARLCAENNLGVPDEFLAMFRDAA